MPFSVFGVKGRLDGVEARLDEIQAEIRALSLRLPEPIAGPSGYGAVVEDSKGRVPFIEMTDFGLQTQCAQKTPASDPEKKFLLQAQFRPAAVQLACDPAVRGEVRGVVRVQEIKLPSADLDLPGAQPDRISGQGDLQAQPLAVGVA